MYTVFTGNIYIHAQFVCGCMIYIYIYLYVSVSYINIVSYIHTQFTKVKYTYTHNWYVGVL